MRRALLVRLWLMVCLTGFLVVNSTSHAADPVIHQAPHPQPSAAYQWLEITLEASGRDVDRVGARPTILSRAMSITLTAMYDAWAAYDDRAVGTRLGGTLRRPTAERTAANRQAAIAYAVYRALLDLYPEDAAWLRGEMTRMGHDPANDSRDVATPAGIGNTAAMAVVEYRHHDGANQLGTEQGSSGQPYSDYTYYRPVNMPDKVTDPTCWMPIPFSDGKGGEILHGFLTPHWYRVRPFALERADQFRPGPPPLWGSEQLRREVDECIAVNAALTLEQKAVVEFMRDGPRSTGQSGHWLRFAQDLSRRDRYGLDQDVKLFFSVSNVVFDAFVACWESKRHYDTSRPYWWVRQYYPGQKIRGWAGPGQGVAELPAERWVPYSPATFVTPPFPGYASGHATASGGGARMLELFTGSDRFGVVAVRQAGELTESEFSTAQMQARDGRPARDVPASKEVRLDLPTFSATAKMAATSRLWGGYHIRSDNEAGLVLGRNVADFSWPRYQALFNGTAPAPQP